MTVWELFVKSPDIGIYLHTGFSWGLLKARDRSDGHNWREGGTPGICQMGVRDASHRVQGSLTPGKINSPNINSDEPGKLSPESVKFLTL